MLWRTERADEPQQPVSEIVSAKYLSRAVMIHLGLNVTASASGMWPGRSPDVIRHLGTIMAGAKATNLPIEIRIEATNIKSYSFSLPDRNNLIALWTDGVAVDDDPGVKATLILPGFSDQWVMGIDVLHGFQQQMITDTEGENLVIRNLMVKDYPIILRIAPTRYVFLPVVVKGYAR